MEWDKKSRGFWSSQDGRFDLIEVPGDSDGNGLLVGGYYRVIDWDEGTSKRCGSFTEAEVWARSRLTQTAA